MKIQEILTIIGLSCLGLCLLLCLLKMSMKDKKGQANCDKSCGMLFFAAAVLIGVSQLLKETSEPYHCHAGASPATGKVDSKGHPCSPDMCISNNPGTFPEANGNSCPKEDNNGNPIPPSKYATCYTPDANGCYSSGPGGGGSACGPPPGIPVPGIPYAPLFAGNNQLCSEAIKKLPHGWSTNCENSNFIELSPLGKQKTCSKNDHCDGNFMCNKKGYCELTGDGSYHNVTCVDGDTSGVNIKGNFGFCYPQGPDGSTGMCRISKNTSLR